MWQQVHKRVSSQGSHGYGDKEFQGILIGDRLHKRNKHYSQNSACLKGICCLFVVEIWVEWDIYLRAQTWRCLRKSRLQTVECYITVRWLMAFSVHLPFQIRPFLSRFIWRGSSAGCMHTPLSICANRAGHSFMNALGVIRTLLMNLVYSSSKLWFSVFTISRYSLFRCRSLWSTRSVSSDLGDRHAASGKGVLSRETVKGDAWILVYNQSHCELVSSKAALQFWTWIEH